jgi:hypothetical protein
MSKVLTLKALGADQEAKQEYYTFLDKFGKYELEMERWYDHLMCAASMRNAFGKREATMAFQQ